MNERENKTSPCFQCEALLVFEFFPTIMHHPMRLEVLESSDTNITQDAGHKPEAIEKLIMSSPNWSLREADSLQDKRSSVNLSVT